MGVGAGGVGDGAAGAETSPPELQPATRANARAAIQFEVRMGRLVSKKSAIGNTPIERGSHYANGHATGVFGTSMIHPFESVDPSESRHAGPDLDSGVAG